MVYMLWNSGKPSKYGRNIYYHNDDELFIFQHSIRTYMEREGLKIVQNTDYRNRNIA
jgi:hypothetical protein